MSHPHSAIVLAVFLTVTAGCPIPGRWDRASDGGHFIGIRPDLSPDNDSIVFSSPDTGHGDIFSYSISKSRLTRLTKQPNYEGDPEFSPDGTRIVFIREEDSVAHLWLMNSDGSQQTQLTSGPSYDSSPSFSPDGTRVVFTRNVQDMDFRSGSAASGEIFVINIDGTNERRITNNQMADFEPSFSPNGQKILYDVWAKEIWTMNVDGSDQRRIGFGASASFSSDGDKIVFVSGKHGRQLSVMDTETRNTTRIVEANHYMSYPTFYADGKHVLFLAEPGASRSGIIKKLNVETGVALPVVSTRIPSGI